MTKAELKLLKNRISVITDFLLDEVEKAPGGKENAKLSMYLREVVDKLETERLHITDKITEIHLQEKENVRG